MRINDSKTLKDTYELLALAKALGNNDIVKECKKAIRGYRNDNLNTEETVVQATYNSTTYKLKFENANLEEVNDFYEDYLKKSYTRKEYDCTGQLFTSWYKLFKVGDTVILYYTNSIEC